MQVLNLQSSLLDLKIGFLDVFSSLKIDAFSNWNRTVFQVQHVQLWEFGVDVPPGVAQPIGLKKKDRPWI